MGREAQLRASCRGKRRKKKVTTDENLDPDVVRKGVQIHSELNPQLWEGDKLIPSVAKVLKRITDAFVTFLDVPDLEIKGVILTGSNAAFNYTEYSDIDIHIIVDYDSSVCSGLAENYFNTKRSLWNYSNDLKVRGFKVELYVEDTKNPVTAAGIYDLENDSWIKQPKPEKLKIDDEAVLVKASALAEEIDAMKETPTIEGIQRIFENLRAMRKAGLDSAGEFSVENLAFKALRNAGYLDDLWKLKQTLQNDLLVKEKKGIK